MIVVQGERNRRTLIAEAQAQGHGLRENADRQIEARVRDARPKRRSAIAGRAIAKTPAERSGQMTPKIEAHWLNLFLKHITQASSPNKQQ